MTLVEAPFPRPNGFHIPAERDSGEPKRAPLAIEWAADVRPREGSWIVKGLVPDSGLVSIHGPSRACKTFLALEWVLRIAAGEDVLGFKTRRVGVAYVAAEAANGVRKRIRAWVQENDFDDEFLPFGLIGRGVDLSAPENEDVDELIELLRAEQIVFRERGEPLGIVCIDTLARVTPGADENSSADMGAALAALERIGEALGVVVVVIHHTGKDATKGARGHSSFFAALDTAIELTHDEETGVRSLKVAKQKDDEDGRSWSFRLKPVTIGADADGEEITSCVIEYVDAPTTSRPTRAPGKSDLLVYRAIKNALSETGEGSPMALRDHIPSTAIVVKRDNARLHADKLGLSQSDVTIETGADRKRADDKARQEFARSIKNLIGQGFVGHYAVNNREGYLWLLK